MDIDDIKKKYFYYCCNLDSMLRDCYFENVDDVVSIVKINDIAWTEEFQKNLERKMLDSCSKIDFFKCYGKYIVSQKSFNDFYDLAVILFRLISTETLIFEEIFIYFYELVFFTDRVSFKKNLMKRGSLIDYYRIQDYDKFVELVEFSKVVVAKDLFHSNQYKSVCEFLNGNINRNN